MNVTNVTLIEPAVQVAVAVPISIFMYIALALIILFAGMIGTSTQEGQNRFYLIWFVGIILGLLPLGAIIFFPSVREFIIHAGSDLVQRFS